MDSVDSQIEMKVPEQAGRHRLFWRASATALFLPALVVAAGYAVLWLFLNQTGRGGGHLARVSMLVLVIGVPILLVHAGLRLSTTRLTLRGAHLEAHPGFPARDPVIVAYASITGLSVRRGLSGWLTGAGSLIIERGAQPRVIVSGMARADSALLEVTARCPAINGTNSPA
ncbi:hypothetical protein OEG84_09735 [Hoeflea sp. G2-23]|uniref:DUF304 domain-containing protein n=1 Tax=Hoeflea algicola TaxID=2983763 RepID=A0ABT3Z870_9HYPH|nr:hypothetical protein [Hoeflea algicola]MCY0147982.1 hypothetical protein [Hoeflea algicola]